MKTISISGALLALGALAIAAAASGAGWWISSASNAARHSAPSAKASPPVPPQAILYYRNPMGTDTSPVPKKDPMGMDYVPVYRTVDDPGTVTVSPARLQMLGVKTVTVESGAVPGRTIRAAGTVEIAENAVVIVNTRFDGFVEKLLVATAGTPVRAGQPLARVWIQTPDAVTRMGPDVVTREVDYIVALQAHDDDAAARALRNLRLYGIPDSAIAEIRRTGQAVRSIVITAPIGGTVLEKPAIQGERFNTGDPLFKIADLSKVWVVAQIPEQDLGWVRAGQAARIGLVAFPGKTFAGTVDFLYPTLDAATRTGKVRIVLANKDGLLREGMYATVDIAVPGPANGDDLQVPETAIIDGGRRQMVLVEEGPGRFVPRTVRIGAQGDGAVQVLSGLTAGEKVVAGANFLIDAESNLKAALRGFTADGADGTEGQP